MSARRTQRAFTLDDEDDDVSYIPGISTAASDAVTSPRSPAKGGVGAQAAQIGAGALSRTTTAAERIQGRFRTWMAEKREKLRSAAERMGTASSSSGAGGAGGVPSIPRPASSRYARVDSDSDSDHDDTRAYCAPGAIDEMRKVVLEVKGEAQLTTLAGRLTEAGVDHKLWMEQPENYPTCLSTRPYRKSEIAHLFKKCNLAKGTIGGGGGGGGS